MDDFDRSARYSALVKLFIERRGSLPKDQRRDLATERATIAGRVLPKMDLVFMTLNNSGSEWIQDNFDPSVLVIDEAGQAPISLMAVPLTGFRNYKGVIALGDDHQLNPLVLSTGLNEVAQNARQSVMGLLKSKNFPTFKLNMQYRMAPEIVKFVNKWIYNSELTNHPNVLKPHPIRDACRKVALEHYAIQGPHGKGSEYVMVNVAYGTARPEPNGSSLQNFANADAIVKCVGRLLENGVPASEISILSYYRGQLNITVTKIKETTAQGGPTRTWSFDEVSVHTTGSFQGQETGVAIVDMVAASKEFDKLKLNSEIVEAGSSYITISGHVKNANRICVALSRGKYGLFAFCQVALLLATYDSSQSKRANIAYQLASDALGRELVYDDFETLDSHPNALKERASWPLLKKAQEEERAKSAQLKFIGDKIRQARKARKPEKLQPLQAPSTPKPTPTPVHKTMSGMTTRPIGPENIVKPADEYDVANPPTFYTGEEGHVSSKTNETAL